MSETSKTYFISGHLDITLRDFKEKYYENIDLALKENASFVVGDSRDVDTFAQNIYTIKQKMLQFII